MLREGNKENDVQPLGCITCTHVKTERGHNQGHMHIINDTLPNGAGKHVYWFALNATGSYKGAAFMFVEVL